MNREQKLAKRKAAGSKARRVSKKMKARRAERNVPRGEPRSEADA